MTPQGSTRPELNLPDPLPELPADADINDVIDALIELGLVTQAEA